MRQRSADRNALLLAARELRRTARPLVRKARPVRAARLRAGRESPVGARKPELEPDELARRKVGVERARVVLLHIAQCRDR